jgi:outer membrane protein assembly factor BamB
MKILIIITALLLSISTFGQIKSQWRGPERNGIYPDKNLLNEWPESGPELLWSFNKLGNGYSSAAIADEFVFIAGTEDSINYIYKLNLDGQLIWKKDISEGWTRNFPGIRSTPMIVDNMGYIINGFGELFCFNIENGDIIWQKIFLSLLNLIITHSE